MTSLAELLHIPCTGLDGGDKTVNRNIRGGVPGGLCNPVRVLGFHCHVLAYIYIYIYICIYVCIYIERRNIYIYIERERRNMYILYIYLYIYMEEREKEGGGGRKENIKGRSE